MKNPASASPETICSRAAALLSSGLSDEALELLEFGTRHFPTQANIASRYADALHLAGRLNEAIEAYQIALQLDATAGESWYGLGCAHLARREYGSAAHALKCAVALQADAGGPNLNLGKALFQLGHVDAAIDHFRRASRAGNRRLRRSHNATSPALSRAIVRRTTLIYCARGRTGPRWRRRSLPV